MVEEKSDCKYLKIYPLGAGAFSSHTEVNGQLAKFFDEVYENANDG